MNKTRRIARMLAQTALPPQPTHRTTRQNDEWACSCGRRWALEETDPHGRVDGAVNAR